MRSKFLTAVVATAVAMTPALASAAPSAARLSLSPEIRTGAKVHQANQLEGAGEVAIGIGASVAAVVLFLVITDAIDDDDNDGPNSP